MIAESINTLYLLWKDSREDFKRYKWIKEGLDIIVDKEGLLKSFEDRLKDDYAKEEWRDAPGLEGFFQISSLGRLKNVQTGIIPHPRTFSNGYYYFDFTSVLKSEKRISKIIHRLVAEAFIPNPDNKPEVDHINGIRTDNRVENLRWVTRSENMKNPVTRVKYCKLIDGVPAIDIAASNGIKPNIVRCRVYRGWSLKDAVTIPMKGGQK